MPLNRYQLRNEYSLADPELYRVADKDDPEALLEGVAMAGLVGLLRQLGDLAEFAAEVFHDLHEQVVATASRGHGLTFRVQQLEEDLPSIQKKLPTETNHTTPLYHSGIVWHPNLHVDQSLITRGDLPRFVMDSYEECRGPPRLFLLDKFDVGGAGACLKRYTDPSFFKVESDPTGFANSDALREKRIHKVKKLGPKWRNGETPESFTASHAKLHQLLLVDHFENGDDDPERRTKLKKRQFSGSLSDEMTRKAYMDKFLKTCFAEKIFVSEISANPLFMNLLPNNTWGSGREIVEVGTVSRGWESKHKKERLMGSLPDVEEIVKSTINESSGVIDEDLRGSSLPNYKSNTDNNLLAFSVRSDVKEAATYSERKSEVGEGEYHLGYAPSEVDSYMDALASMESEFETDSEYSGRKILKYVPRTVLDSDASGGHGWSNPSFLDSQSGLSSNRSDSLNSSFKERDSLPCTSAARNIIDAATYDDGAAAAIDSPVCSGGIEKDNSEFTEAARSSCFANLNTTMHSSEIVARSQEHSVVKQHLDEKSSMSRHDRLFVDSGERWKVLGANGSCKETFSAAPSPVRDDLVLLPERPGEEVTYENSDVSCKAVSFKDKYSDASFDEKPQLEAAYDGALPNLAGGRISSFRSASSPEDEWIHSPGQLEVVDCSNVVLPLNSSSLTTHSYLDIANSASLASEDHCGASSEENLEKLPLLEPTHSPGLLVQHLSEITDADPSPNINLLEKAGQVCTDNLSHMVAHKGAEDEEINPELGTLSDIAAPLYGSPSIHSLPEIVCPDNLSPEEDNFVPSTGENSSGNLPQISSSIDCYAQQHLSEKIVVDHSPEHDLQEEDTLVYQEHSDRGTQTASSIEEIEVSTFPENGDTKQKLVVYSDVTSTLDSLSNSIDSLPYLTGDGDLATEEYQCTPLGDKNVDCLPLLLVPTQSSSELHENLLDSVDGVLGLPHLTEEDAHVYQDTLSCIRISKSTEHEDAKASMIPMDLRETTSVSALAPNGATSELLLDRQEPSGVEIHSSGNSTSYSINVPCGEERSSTTTSKDMVRSNVYFHMSALDVSQTDISLELLISQTADVASLPEPDQSEVNAEPVRSEANRASSDSNSGSAEEEATFDDTFHVHLPNKELDSSTFEVSCKDSAFLDHGESVSAHVGSVTAGDRETDAGEELSENLLPVPSTFDAIPLHLLKKQKESTPAKQDSMWNNLEVSEWALHCDGGLNVLDDVYGRADDSVNAEQNSCDEATTDLQNPKLLKEGPDSLAEDSHRDANFISVAEAEVSSKKHAKEIEVSSSNDTQSPECTSSNDNAEETKAYLEAEIEHQGRDTEVELLHAVEVPSNSFNYNEQTHGQSIKKEIWVEIGYGSCSVLPSGQPSVPKIFQPSCEHTVGNWEVVASSASVAPHVDTLVDEGHTSPELAVRTHLRDPLNYILSNTAEICMEEMPPLPPLPPMQWRLGRLQHASLPVERPVQHDVDSVIPSKASNPESIEYVDPFLLTSNLKDAKLQDVSNYSGGCGMPGTSTESMQSIDCENYQLGPLYFPTSAACLSPQNDLQNDQLNVDHMEEHEQAVGSLARNNVSVSTDAGETKYQSGVTDKWLHHISPVTNIESTMPPLGIGSSALRHYEQQLPQGLMAPGEMTAWLSNTSDLIPISDEGTTNGTLRKKLPRPRNPLIDAVVSVDKSKLRKVGERVKPHTEEKVEVKNTVLEALQLRKVGERVKPQVEQKVEQREAFIDVPQLRKVGESAKSPGPKEEDRDVLLEQIKNKSFNLKPIVTTRPSIQGPKTNLKVAVLLEKVNKIRQATAGCDEDDSDGWSDA